MNKIIIYSFVLNLLICLSCGTDELTYNPCLRRFQTEDFRPATHSLDWIPYSDNQELLFRNNTGNKIRLLRTKNNDLIESLSSHFKIKCPNDSLQTSEVYYRTLEYQNTFNLLEGQTPLISIDVYADVIFDEITSTLDDTKLADILKLVFKIKNNNLDSATTLVLQFPVLDRGYKNALSYGYHYSDSIVLDNHTFYNVYSNFQNNEQIRAYYSELGLLAFEIQGVLFIRN